MMTREKFRELIYNLEEYNDFIDELYKLNIDVYECKYVDYAGIFFDELMKSEFGEDGLGLISWWLYEDVDHKIYESTDETKEWYYPEEEIHGNVIADLNNIDDLYDYLTKGGRDQTNVE